MWQGQSMIPKPRLSTPRRAHPPQPTTQHQTPSRNPRTPSRLPRAPVTRTDPSPNTPVTSNNPVRRLYQSTNTTSERNRVESRGDTLAERVISSGIISERSRRFSTFDTPTDYDRFSLPPAISNFPEAASDIQPTKFSEIQSNMEPRTPPRTPKSYVENTYSTPVKYTTPSRAHQPTSPEPLVIDEQLVTRTPAKHKNTEWLASFGIDISLLKLTDDEENQNPNVTPSRDYQSQYSRENTPTSTPKPKSFQRRRATDFYGYAKPIDTLPNPPTRIASARKSRRASARISVRELDALNFRQEDPCVPQRNTAGSDVFLTPVRASRKQREKNGTPVVLSEVRRSLRINTPSKQLVPKNSVRGRIELLEANDHSYIPNHCLSDRSFSG